MLLLLEAMYRILQRVSNGAERNAHLNILRINFSAFTNIGAPPDNANYAGLKHPKITLP